MRLSRTYLLALLMFTAIFCLGMGGFGGDQPLTSIPKPDREFTVDLIDKSDTSFEVRKFSIDGVTYLPATLGLAEMGIDFADISSADMFLQDDKVLAKVRFKDGSVKDLAMSPKIEFFGETDWGKIKIRADEISRVTFK